MTETGNANDFVSRQVEASRLFFLDHSSEDEFSVVFGGFESCDPDYRIDRRDYPWFALEFVSRGSGKLRLADREEVLQPGSFYVYGPEHPHVIESSKDRPLGKYFVGFKGTGVAKFLKSYEMNPGMISRCLKSEPIRRSFDMLIDRGVRKGRLVHPICASITQQLLMMCRDDAADVTNTDTTAYATYRRVKEYIEANFLTLTKLETIAAACELDAPYLCRLFSRYHDESPYQFLTRLRMTHASRILLETNFTVKTVAAVLGFKDAFHFSRVFKSIQHVAPSRFRQSMHPQRSE